MSDLAALIVHLTDRGWRVAIEPAGDDLVLELEPVGPSGAIWTRRLERTRLAGARGDRIMLELEALARAAGVDLDPTAERRDRG